jgi:hypothetical protein
MHCLSLITDLKLINCVDTSDYDDLNFGNFSPEGLIPPPPDSLLARQSTSAPMFVDKGNQMS